MYARWYHSPSKTSVPGVPEETSRSASLRSSSARSAVITASSSASRASRLMPDAPRHPSVYVHARERSLGAVPTKAPLPSRSTRSPPGET